MAKNKTHAQVGKRVIELSNLDKILYPDDGIVKAEVIEYYLKLAPTILNHIRGRALSLVRYPDGIYGEQFFQKHRPDWTPDWIDYKRLGQERLKEYVVAKEDATLVWLANLACLEIHQIHSFSEKSDRPDYIVYDLDPPEDGFDIEELKGIAFSLKEHLERAGYHPHVKTTGGKGLHILTPIEANYTFDECFECAKLLATDFINRHANTTLHIKKESRKGRVLIDIYRNRPSQTIVAPYSLRGRVGATASTPISWDELGRLTNLGDYNLKTTLDRVISEGDVWEAIRGWAVPLHTDRKTVVARELPTNERHKSPEQLAAYEKKRDFNKTPEPPSVMDESGGSRFVIQRHHASHLHYDLRLEQDGVLKSWAIPRGMPPAPGVKRLAVQTEDHPLKYLTFEGEIPKQEYGGGMMWIYANGRYEITKEKKNGFYFRLSGPLLSAEYRMHLMKDKEWLLERVDTPQVDFLGQVMKPMLADSAKEVPKGDYQYEVKWDGIRALIYLNEGELTLYSRNLNDITAQFPELNVPEAAFRINNAIFDAEIVCLDPNGKADFKKVIKRLMSKKNFDFESRKTPAYCYLFDCLYLDGRSLMNDPLDRRRWWLQDSVRIGETNYRISEAIDEGEELFEAAKSLGIEGIMAKRRDGKYTPGKRNDTWIKVKVKETMECVIIGFTKGTGDRQNTFGSLQLAEETTDGLIYRGRVGTGFDDRLLSKLRDRLNAHITKLRPEISSEMHEETESIWINGGFRCEVEYSMITENGTFRDPVFRGLIEH
jgi:DNA ligase D-like protein (predicted ligase)/DNA ligase D-like protein (predicted polymerase)/DNA ligase D-like protein (predicted 3'-phosphoesterase)